jgi:hypothetical protein
MYMIGYHKTSPVLITVESVDLTDKKGSIIAPENFYSPFYIKKLINCGRIVKIADIHETAEYETAHVQFQEEKVNLSNNSYFNILNYDYAKGIALTVYMNKTAALETLKESLNFTKSGFRYVHYEGGALKAKLCYQGEFLIAFYYRNDLYNSLEKKILYNSEKIEIINHYDEHEKKIKREVFSHADAEPKKDKDKDVNDPADIDTSFDLNDNSDGDFTGGTRLKIK